MYSTVVYISRMMLGETGGFDGSWNWPSGRQPRKSTQGSRCDYRLRTLDGTDL
jgi:hypothetical protein